MKSQYPTEIYRENRLICLSRFESRENDVYELTADVTYAIPEPSAIIKSFNSSG